MKRNLNALDVEEGIVYEVVGGTAQNPPEAIGGAKEFCGKTSWDSI